MLLGDISGRILLLLYQRDIVSLKIDKVYLFYEQ